MIVGVPKETFPGERCVALVPSIVPLLIKAGLVVLVETDAGNAAGFPNAAYREKGTQIASSRAEVFTSADVILHYPYSRRLDGNRAHRP